jgi:hypothetical protein
MHPGGARDRRNGPRRETIIAVDAGRRESSPGCNRGAHGLRSAVPATIRPGGNRDNPCAMRLARAESPAWKSFSTADAPRESSLLARALGGFSGQPAPPLRVERRMWLNRPRGEGGRSHSGRRTGGSSTHVYTLGDGRTPGQLSSEHAFACIYSVNGERLPSVARLTLPGILAVRFPARADPAPRSATG